jgi:hypothetical protein
MTANNKARRLGKGAGLAKHPDSGQYIKGDPLPGWYSLAKQSRRKRRSG